MSSVTLSHPLSHLNQFLPDPNLKSYKAKILDKKPGEIQELLNDGDDGARKHLSPVSQLMANYEFAAPVRSEKCLPVPELSSAWVYAASPAQAVTAR